MKRLYLRDCEIGKSYVTMGGKWLKLLSKDRRPTKFKDVGEGQVVSQTGLSVQSLDTGRSMVVREDYVVIDVESEGEEEEIRARDVLGRFARYDLPLNDNVRKAACICGLTTEVAEDKPVSVTPELSVTKVPETIDTLADVVDVVDKSFAEEAIVDESYTQEDLAKSDFIQESVEDLPPVTQERHKPKERKPHPWRGNKVSKAAIAEKDEVISTDDSKPDEVVSGDSLDQSNLPHCDASVLTTPVLTSNRQFIIDLLHSSVQTRESLAKELIKSGRTEHTDLKPLLNLVSVILANLRKKDGLHFEDLPKGQYRIIR